MTLWRWLFSSPVEKNGYGECQQWDCTRMADHTDPGFWLCCGGADCCERGDGDAVMGDSTEEP